MVETIGFRTPINKVYGNNHLTAACHTHASAIVLSLLHADFHYKWSSFLHCRNEPHRKVPSEGKIARNPNMLNKKQEQNLTS